MENARFELKDLLHFAPYILFSLIHLLFFFGKPITSEGMDSGVGWFLLNISRICALFLSLGAYSYFSWKLLTLHEKRTRDQFSVIDISVTLNWLKYIIIIFVGTYLLLIINMLAGNLAKDYFESSHIIPALGLNIFCFSLSYFGFQQPQLFKKSIVNVSSKNNDEVSALTEGTRKQYARKMLDYIEKQKPFLNAELTINDLAQQLKMPRHYVTEVLKSELHQNFFNLINDWRINEVKKLLADQRLKRSVDFATGHGKWFQFEVVF